MTAIRDAATESEMVVRDITRDIQSLDLAKKNLVASMNALKRFQMLGGFLVRQWKGGPPRLSSSRELNRAYTTFSFPLNAPQSTRSTN